jgi:hypothetical protein
MIPTTMNVRVASSHLGALTVFADFRGAVKLSEVPATGSTLSVFVIGFSTSITVTVLGFPPPMSLRYCDSHFARQTID